MPVLEFPLRSPLSIANELKGIVKDRVFCDVGCACGDLLDAFQPYCKRVIGVEQNEEQAKVAMSRGFEVIVGKDIPTADIYYVWVTSGNVDDIMKRIKKGIVILAEEDRNKKYGGRQIEIPIKEKNRDIWRLQIVDTSLQGL